MKGRSEANTGAGSVKGAGWELAVGTVFSGAGKPVSSPVSVYSLLQAPASVSTTSSTWLRVCWRRWGGGSRVEGKLSFQMPIVHQ